MIGLHLEGWLYLDVSVDRAARTTQRSSPICKVSILPIQDPILQLPGSRNRSHRFSCVKPFDTAPGIVKYCWNLL